MSSRQKRLAKRVGETKVCIGVNVGICVYELMHCGCAKEFEGTEMPKGFRASVVSCRSSSTLR
jgi:hypothetical protein